MLTRTIFTAGLLAAALGLGSGSAAAQYPPAPEGVNVEDTTPAQGQSTTLSASGFGPRSRVEFWLHSDPVLLGTAVADDAGTATLTVTIPSSVPAGNHTLVVTGTDANGAPVEKSLPLRVVAPASSSASTPSAAPSPSGSALARTGSDDDDLVGLAAILLAGGAVAVVAARRRIAVERS